MLIYMQPTINEMLQQQILDEESLDKLIEQSEQKQTTTTNESCEVNNYLKIITNE